MDFTPSEKAVTIRNPSTANLYIDSLDRPDGETSVDFTISKNRNILSGFFTRIALNEIVLDWCIPNIRAITGNNTFTATVGATTNTVTLPDNFYSVKNCLDSLVALLNTAFGGAGFSITQQTNAPGVFLTNSADWTITETELSKQLNITSGSVAGTRPKYVECPKLLPTAYVDIVCNNLTYCQNLKDSSTSDSERDVLYRWYLAWDNEATYDAYGYPLLQGYRTFLQRRSIAFPKQIQWDNIQPIGQLSFQVYDSTGSLVSVVGGELEFNVSLLVSEV